MTALDTALQIDQEEYDRLLTQVTAIVNGQLTDLAEARVILRDIDQFLLRHLPPLMELQKSARKAVDTLIAGDLPPIIPDTYEDRWVAAGVTSRYWSRVGQPRAPAPADADAAAPPPTR